MQAFYVALTCLAAISAGSLLVYGGVWGVLRLQHVQFATLTARLEVCERQVARQNGQQGRQVARTNMSNAEREADALVAAAANLAHNRRPAPQRPPLKVLEDGTVIAPPGELAAARAAADGGRK